MITEFPQVLIFVSTWQCLSQYDSSFLLKLIKAFFFHVYQTFEAPDFWNRISLMDNLNVFRVKYFLHYALYTIRCSSNLLCRWNLFEVDLLIGQGQCELGQIIVHKGKLFVFCIVICKWLNVLGRVRKIIHCWMEADF